MRHLFVTLSFLISNLIFCQTKVDTIPSIQNNLAWLNKLDEIQDKSDKIKFIVEKIKIDSIYKNEGIEFSTYISESGHLHDKIGSEIPCKLIFVLSDQKSNLELDLNKNPKQSYILNTLNSETIDKITILKGLSATSLFGVKGNCGVVYLNANKKIKILSKN